MTGDPMPDDWCHIHYVSEPIPDGVDPWRDNRTVVRSRSHAPDATVHTSTPTGDAQ